MLPSDHQLLKGIDFEAGDPLDPFKAARDRLRKACSQGGTYHPLNENTQWVSPVFDAYFAVADWLDDRHMLTLAEDLLLGWWNDFSAIQAEGARYVYKAAIAVKLASHYIRFGDVANGFRWSLNTQADDILGGHGQRGGAGKTYLQALYGLSDADIECINTISDKCRDLANEANSGWAQPVGFPEEVIRRLFEEDATLPMKWASSSREFPLTSAYFQALLTRSSIPSKKGKETETGRSLQDLTSYLLSLLPGCVPRCNLKGVTETDIVVHNFTRVADITVDLLGRNFIVECKNWAKAVGVSQIGYFLHRMQLAHVRFGIIFSKHGVTGSNEGEAARALIRDTYYEIGNLCIVIDNKDLQRLADNEKPSFWTLLLSKIEEFRFGK